MIMNQRRILTRLGLVLTLWAMMSAGSAYGQDPDIERLLKKLPPPEKLVKPIDPSIRAQFELLNDPLTTQIGTAVAYRNVWQYMRLCRKLVERYPKNPWAHCIHGSAASNAAKFPEATAAFKEAVKLQPDFTYAYLQLGAVDVIQRRFASAIPYFKKVVALQPKAAIGWVFLSGCFQRLGRLKESLDYANRAVAFEPQSSGTWLQLAHAENASGHVENAKRALARAQQLMRSGN
jgi:predicted Zn-dependent protease